MTVGNRGRVIYDLHHVSYVKVSKEQKSAVYNLLQIIQGAVFGSHSSQGYSRSEIKDG